MPEIHFVDASDEEDERYCVVREAGGGQETLFESQYELAASSFMQGLTFALDNRERFAGDVVVPEGEAPCA